MDTTSKFSFKENDPEGFDNLNAIESAIAFNCWMFETIEPFCKGKILEIGSGIGNISCFFIDKKYDITLSDIRNNYCQKLIEKFSKHKVLQFDITDPNFDTIMQSEFQTYDTIFALNVVEHIKNDTLALQNIHKLLKKDGNAIILVPAFQKLYNRFDLELEHYRRYSKSDLITIFDLKQFKITHKQYFNFMGIFGWYISGKLQKNKTIPKNQMKLYDFLVPIFKIIDKIVGNKIGLSVIVIGNKN